MGDHKVNTNALRQKILDLAIHGKLVKQDPADEPASVMLEKLRAEKKAKIAAGEIKRNKNDSYIFKYTGTSGENKTDDNPEGLVHNRHYEKFADGRVKDIEDEIPFAVPEGWAWCRLGEIINIKSGDAIKVRENQSGKYPIYGGNGITGYYSEFNIDIPTMIIGRVGFNCGTIHITKGKAWITDNAFITTFNTAYCDLTFLSFALQFLNLSNYSNSTAQPVISGKSIYPIFLALPPLTEQHRIVTAIEAIFTQIELLEQNKADLQTAVKQAKSKILDLAIHGKLVKQDPADEPASVMLEKLRAEKEAKIAAGEIKRGKNDSYIYRKPTDNCYYEKFDDGTEVAIEIDSIIPEAWIWCYFSDIADVINGKNQSKVKDDAGKYPIYGSGGIIGYANDYICPKNCTIIGRKGSINNPIFTEEKSWNVDTAFGLVPSSIILPRYLFYFCKSFDFTSLDSSTTLPSLTKTNIQHILFPLPPLAAQQRILDKIDELFSQLDKIALNIV